jgi:two-component system NtrC family sensor kinase
LKNPRFSVETKVLLPVIAFLVALPVLVVWIVNDYVSGQVHDEAATVLATADGVFRHLVENQSRDLLSRYRGAVEDPGPLQKGYRDLLGLAGARSAVATNTVHSSLAQQLGGDTVVMLLSLDPANPPIGVRGDLPLDLPAFAHATTALSRSALQGEAAATWVTLDGTVLNAAAVPISLADNQVGGALTVGARLGEAAIQDFKQLTGTEIVLLADGRAAASTLGSAGGALPGLPAGGAQQVVVNGEHYLALRGVVAVESGAVGFRYILLSSYERSLRTLERMRQTLAEVSLVGILLSAVVVWIFIRRTIHPLRELRDTAEAVGRGDFSRKIGRVANDECGDLAEAFNRMTGNLQASRAELERAVETLKATQTQLIQSEKLSAVGQFVAGVAHELNNPLTAVIGFSDLLVQTSTDGTIRAHLERIAKNAHRCHKIVQNLLGFARQHPPERTLVAINGAVDEVLDIMAYDFRTGNVEVVRDFQADLPLIQADRHQLQQVFVNILSNGRQAIQAFRPDGRIVIRTRAEGGKARIEFVDNGPGVQPENLSRLFDPFFTTKPIGKGTGLGLSLCYGIVREHGGTIVARSEPGQGATFAIELPVAPDGAQLRDTDGTAPASGRVVGAGRAVLVVDDEEEIRILTEELLRHDGYAVETAASGEKAIDALARRRFDVIVSDWKMPGMNGIQFYEHLLTTDRPAAARVCFMTGDVVNDAFQEFLRRHGRPCLPKPFSIKDFQNAVADLLERAPS